MLYKISLLRYIFHKLIEPSRVVYTKTMGIISLKTKVWIYSC